MTRAILLLAIVLAVLAPGRAAAGPPTDQVRGSIDRVLQILTDPDLKKEAKTADRRAAIRTVASEIFDFTEISQRSLARHWAGRSPAERQEFVRLFGELLEYSYITKIEAYSGEKIAYGGDTIEGEQATVKTRLLTKSQPQGIPIDYRVQKEGDRWRAYDVLIEGVSLVGNYRTQFNRIIQQSGYDELVKKMKTKQEELVFDEAAQGKKTP